MDINKRFVVRYYPKGKSMDSWLVMQYSRIANAINIFILSETGMGKRDFMLGKYPFSVHRSRRFARFYNIFLKP